MARLVNFFDNQGLTPGLSVWLLPTVEYSLGNSLLIT